MNYYELLDRGINFIDNVFNFAEMVRRYDTWEWKTIFKDNNSKQLNDLLRIYGRDKFIEKMVVKLNNNKYIFDENDKLVLELEQEKINRYIEDKNTKIIPKVIKGFNIGIVFAEQYISELGNRLAELNPHLDFIAMIDMSTVNYRGIKENIDLGQFAKLYGGGGHPKASGSQISDEIRNKIIDLIFN
ncbi:hypothetical protein [Clostridium ganghwense]|uniref:DHHA1 domain-containing protein n=1 Tax=Clostridium ganghwense TaxID=312089 RepID=A0ABT4CU63_9CLOT|nr:hypothetical protein [Clostridium ganghwense]MCY6372577.1 hypothetical protein [Clostridium ganghwense]